MAQIVVIGAGTAGASTAKALRKKLDATHRVIVIERDEVVYFPPTFIWLVVGKRKLRETGIPTVKLRSSGIEVIIDTVNSVDINQNIVVYNGTILPYDYLVLALGAEVRDNEDEALRSVGYNMYTIDGVFALREQVRRLQQGRVVIMATSLPFKCPPALYEMALLLEEWFSSRPDTAVEIHLYTPEKTPFEATGWKLGAALEEILQARKIHLHTDQHYISVDPEGKTISFTSGQVPFDLLVYVPPHRPPTLASMTGLADESGWIPVDPFTLETRRSNVYAVGDVNRITPTSGLDLPKTGAYATFQGKVVADHIISKIKQRPPERFFGTKSGCIIETSKTTSLGMLHDLYKPTPQSVVFPESRVWTPGKWVLEKVWFGNHQ